MSFFAYHYVETMLSEMGGPKRRGLFNSEAVFDAPIVDMTVTHMIDYASALGACRPQLALQILATAYKNRDWESKDAPQILDFINKSKQYWEEKKGLAPHDIIKFFSFSEHEELVSVKTLHDKEIQSGMEQKFVEGLLWGLANSNEFKSWYEIDRKEKESHIPEYKSAGLKVRQFPELSEYLQECEKMVGEYVKKMGILSQIPQKLSNDASRLGIEGGVKIINDNSFYKEEEITENQKKDKTEQDEEMKPIINPKRTGRFWNYSKTMGRDEAIDVYKMWLLHVRYYHPKLDVLFQGVSIPTFFLPVPMELLQEVPKIIKKYKKEDGSYETEESIDNNIGKYAHRYYPRTGNDEEIIKGIGNTINNTYSFNQMMSKINENKDDWYFEYKEI